MKVLMTTDTVGGVWTYAHELAAALRSRGVEVEVVPVRGRLEWQDEPWEDVARTGRWLLELAEELRPDVVHLDEYAHGALPWRVPTVVVGHSCVLSWWRAVRGEEAPPHWDRYRRAVRAGLHGADAVVAPTAWMLGELRRLYGVAGGRVIHNGVADRFAARPKKEPFVLGAGRLWDEAKGLGALEGAAAAVSWPVEVAGEGGAGATAVTLLGKLDRAAMDERLARAAIFAHPARYEPFGLAPLEAGLAGCALVLGDLPSLREVWADAATYVRPGDGAALADALERLIEDGGRRERMGRRARERALRYSAERMAGAYVAQYEAIRQAVPA